MSYLRQFRTAFNWVDVSRYKTKIEKYARAMKVKNDSPLARMAANDPHGLGKIGECVLSIMRNLPLPDFTVHPGRGDDGHDVGDFQVKALPLRRDPRFDYHFKHPVADKPIAAPRILLCIADIPNWRGTSLGWTWTDRFMELARANGPYTYRDDMGPQWFISEDELEPLL